MQASQKKMNAMVEDWSKNAPAGSEAAVAAMKQAIASASTIYENSQKAMKQALDVAQTNLNNATDSVLKATEKASKSAKR
jgi:hypothetical protein